MDIELADTLPDGWRLWLDWHNVVAPDNEAEIRALEADRGDYLGYVRLVGRRQGQAELADHNRVLARTVHEEAFAASRGVVISSGIYAMAGRERQAATARPARGDATANSQSCRA